MKWLDNLFRATYGSVDAQLKFTRRICTAPHIDGLTCTEQDMDLLEKYGQALTVAKRLMEVPWVVTTINGRHNLVCSAEIKADKVYRAEVLVARNVDFLAMLKGRPIKAGEPLCEVGITILSHPNDYTREVEISFLGPPVSR